MIPLSSRTLAFFSPRSRVTGRSSLLACLLALLAALLLWGGGPAGPGEASAAGLVAPKRLCPDLPANGGAKAMAKARRSMVCMVNYARRKSRLKVYRGSRQLTWAARRKASDILRCEFSHEACGRRFDYWIRRSGYLGDGGWALGENIAWGGGSLGRVRAIFVAWMKSKGHRDAILSSRFSDVGAGVVKGRFEGVSGARIWVLHFGDN